MTQHKRWFAIHVLLALAVLSLGPGDNDGYRKAMKSISTPIKIVEKYDAV